jgi:hypothetical protein
MDATAGAHRMHVLTEHRVVWALQNGRGAQVTQGVFQADPNQPEKSSFNKEKDLEVILR